MNILFNIFLIISYKNNKINFLLNIFQNAEKYCADFIKEHENEAYTMMDTLFNQERITEIHEKNLVWEGYNNGFAEVMHGRSDICIL